jgi:hypothetical protein
MLIKHQNSNSKHQINPKIQNQNLKNEVEFKIANFENCYLYFVCFFDT